MIQKRFLKHLLGVGSGCPTPALYWETGILRMKWRILKSKLLFYHHLLSLPSNSLANEVLRVQEELELPGLVSECKAFLVQHRIPNALTFNKMQWKKMIKAKINELNEAELIEQSLAYKKINYSGKKLVRQGYISEMRADDGRTMFKLQTNMMPSVQMNFMSNTEYTKNLWTCTGCNAKKDSQSHIMSCPAYLHLRVNKNFDTSLELVTYFREVLKLRQDVS